MPPKRKRQRAATTNLAHAGSVKQRLQDGKSSSRGLSGAVPSMDILQKHLSVGATKAAELAGLMIGKPLMTVVNWRSHFLEKWQDT